MIGDHFTHRGLNSENIRQFSPLINVKKGTVTHLSPSILSEKKTIPLITEKSSPEYFKNDDRFKEMKIIGQKVTKEIPKLVSILEEYRFFEDKHLENFVLGYLRKKAGKKTVRSYSPWKFFDYLCYYQPEARILDKQGLFSQKLPLLFEMIITTQYLHNHMLDEKYNSTSDNHQKSWKNLISSNLLEGMVFSYLEKEINPLIEAEQIAFLRNSILKLFMKVNIGQRIDKYSNSYKAWKEGVSSFSSEKWLGDDFCRSLMIPHIEKIKEKLNKGSHFTDIYFHRIYLTSAYFFRVIADIITSFFPKVASDKKEKLVNFSILYGFMLQIINDYADFAYSHDEKEQKQLNTAGKTTTDLFADLYNFNITLPLIIHLQKEHNLTIEAYLNKGVKTKKTIHQNPLKIVNEIKASGGIEACISLSKNLAKAANSHLDKRNPASSYLTSMTDMANCNKFYKTFKL